MKRSAGVTAAAVVLLLGSGFLLVFGGGYTIMEAVVATMAFTAEAVTRPALLVLGFFYLNAFIFLGAAGWGIATAVAILRLKNWARYSIIAISILGILDSFAWPVTMPEMKLPTSGIPAELNGQQLLSIIHAYLFTVSLVPFFICVWWLILFLLPSVRHQFAQSSPSNDSAAPSQRRPT